jgi:AraC family transcriptional regulator
MEIEFSRPNKVKMFELVLEALDFIEGSLMEPISIKDVTAQFEKSHWQFQRTFTSVLGISMGQYLRERRLTEASRMLRESKGRNLDIAIDFDFGSEEAFSRSFKNFFGVSPTEYKQSGNLVLREARNKVDREKLEYYWKNVQRTPELIHCEAKTLVGMSIDFKSHFVLGSSCHAMIIPHWVEFKKRMDLIPKRVGDHRIGVVLSSELELREEKLTYFSSVEVSEVTDLMENMQTVSVPNGLYACFENRTLSEKHGHLIDYIYGIWLPSSDYDRRPGYDYEVFDHRYVAGNPDSVSRFYVPVITRN